MIKVISKRLKGFLKRDAGTHASSIAFFFFMSFIPLLILFASVVPLLGISIDSIIRFFRELFPEGSSKLTEDIIREAFDHSTAAFSLSALMLLWTASRGINALTKGLNTMYDERENRGFAKLAFQSIGYTMVLLAFLSAAIYLIFSGKISSFLQSVFPQIRLQAGFSTFLEYLMLLAFGCLFFCFVYRYLPSGKRSLSRQFPGAFLASTGWVLFSMGFRVYVSQFNSFTRFYGSLATVIILLFWFFWIFFILLGGGYVNAHIKELLPGRFLAFYQEKKALGLLVSGLFLAGFFSYMSECWLYCRVYAFPSLRLLPVFFRIATMVSWFTATVLCVKGMKMSFSRTQMMLLVLMMAGNVVFMRRSFISNLFLFLVVFSLWTIAILCMCVLVIFREDRIGKTGRRRFDRS